MELSPQVCSLIQQTANSFSGSHAAGSWPALSSSWPSANAKPNAASAGAALPSGRPSTKRAGITCHDATSSRGRKPVEFHLPHLLDDIRAIVQDHCQTDPSFQTTRLYCRLTAPEVRRQLIQRKGYTEEQLPSVQTIGEKLNALGFRLRKVAKCRPQKK